MNGAPAAGCDLDALAALAERLADSARAEVSPYYRTPLSFEDKADTSPVTEIDRAAEARMRGILGEAVPEHGVVGEEYGPDRPDAEFVWVLDPIDGTKRFITGSPLFGCLVALLHQGKPLIGIIEMPVLQERWIGIAGRPSRSLRGGSSREISCRPCPTLDRACLGVSSPDMFKDPADFEAFERVHRAVKLPLFGGDCFNYGLLAQGFIDLVVEADLVSYDFSALVPVVEGAGGRITDWSGAPLGLESDGRVVAAGDPALHEAALAKLAES